MRSIDFFFDFSSTNSYFAAFMLPQLAAKTGTEVNWLPIHSAGLFRGTGFDVMAMTPRKARYLWRDHARYAEFTGLPFRKPSRFPIKTATALRCAIALSGPARTAFCQAVFRSYWERDEDISDPPVLGALARGAGLEADAILRAAGSPEIRGELRAITSQAAERGVFGVPMFSVDGEMFWGKDRLDFVARLLERA
ncbi:MAG: 2-hydroxychromene-2-carboxylate isomerase [Candidatus Binataceae bacterium]